MNTLFLLLLCVGYYLKVGIQAGKSTFYGLIFDIINKDGVEHVNKTLKIPEDMTLDELGMSRGACYNNFLDYMANEDNQSCYIDDEYILHLLHPSKASELIRKAPVRVKCLDKHPLVQKGMPKLHIMESVEDIVDALKPIGNNTKRYQPGSCVLVYFYTPTCLACTLSVFPVNELAHSFPTIPVAAIDAYKYSTFNAEFGVVALPTLILFHQGRPIVKYRQDAQYSTFVTRHTGIQPKPCPKCFKLPPLPVIVENQTDYFLILAWLFIIICAAYRFSMSQLWKQIVDVIKRNWRESVEQQLEEELELEEHFQQHLIN